MGAPPDFPIEESVARHERIVPAPSDAPSDFSDEAHVFNGCYPSALGFLTRYLATFPDEIGDLITFLPRNTGAAPKPHTIAVFTWRGAWWGRDEYFGVFPIGRKLRDMAMPAQVAARAQTACENFTTMSVSSGRTLAPPRPPPNLSTDQRLRAVLTATQLLPLRSRVFYVRTAANTEVPVLFFRPKPETVAVYDPQYGTAVADCGHPNDAAIVREIASRLGYPVLALRALPENSF